MGETIVQIMPSSLVPGHEARVQALERIASMPVISQPIYDFVRPLPSPRIDPG